MEESPVPPPARPPASPGPGEPDDVELAEAARLLGLGSQALWGLIEQHGLNVLRRRRGARGISALSRADFDRLLAANSEASNGSHAAGPNGAAGGLSAEPWLARVREAEARAAAWEEEARELRCRLVAADLEVTQAQRQTLDLRERYEAERRAASRAMSERAQELELARAEGSTLEHHLDEARERGELSRAELRAQRDSLRRKLTMARRIEQAHEAYIDRLERERIDAQRGSKGQRAEPDDDRRLA